MKILFFGDIFGRPGRQAVAEALPKWRKEYAPDLVLANAENASHGAGVTASNIKELQQAGVDAFSLGDHYTEVDAASIQSYPIAWPVNAKSAPPSNGLAVDGSNGEKVLLVSLLGYAFLKRPGDHYFQAIDRVLDKARSFDAVIVDFHAEASSEKQALGLYLDGKVTAVLGTHTHTPTADARILPKGTAFQTDIGFCGAENSVIGLSKETAWQWLRRELGEELPKPSGGPEESPPIICDAVLVDTKSATQASSITRLSSRPE